MSRHDDPEPTSSYTFPVANEWQKERGYDPILQYPPKARFHANGKYATGIYKKWLEENQ